MPVRQGSTATESPFTQYRRTKKRRMAEYKSTVHVSPFPQQRVYDRLSDLTFLTLIQNNLDNPEMRQRILDQADGKVTAEQLDTANEKIRQMQVDRDSVTSDSPVGKITLRIVEREEPKCVKFALEGAPVQDRKSVV